MDIVDFPNVLPAAEDSSVTGQIRESAKRFARMIKKQEREYTPLSDIAGTVTIGSYWPKEALQADWSTHYALTTPHLLNWGYRYSTHLVIDDTLSTVRSLRSVRDSALIEAVQQLVLAYLSPIPEQQSELRDQVNALLRSLSNVQSSAPANADATTTSQVSGVENTVTAPHSLRSNLPESLLQKQQEAIRLAKEYQISHGDPVENLANLLDELVQDEDLWQSILDEPYR
jgi:tetrahydromethanopterin S-methyltransferase subunit B